MGQGEECVLSALDVGFVIISHHPKIAEGVAKMVSVYSGGNVLVRAATGDKGVFGASPGRILTAIQDLEGLGAKKLLAFVDVESSVLCTKALLSGEPTLEKRVRIVDAPLLEGAIAAALTSYLGGGVDECERAAIRARVERKLLTPGREES